MLAWPQSHHGAWPENTGQQQALWVDVSCADVYITPVCYRPQLFVSSQLTSPRFYADFTQGHELVEVI